MLEALGRSAGAPKRGNFMGTLVRSALVFFALAAVGNAQSSQYPAQIDLGDLLPSNGGDGSLGFVAEGLAAGDRRDSR